MCVWLPGSEQTGHTGQKGRGAFYELQVAVHVDDSGAEVVAVKVADDRTRIVDYHRREGSY